MTEIDQLRQWISLISLAEAAGARFDASRSRSRCPLPRHAGDRSSNSFVIYENGTRWKCHSSCPSDANGGDVFAFYMAWKGVDFKTALKDLSGNDTFRSLELPAAAPRIMTQPEQWRKRAAEFVAYAESNLSGPSLDYLIEERGLTPASVRAFRLGYNPENLYESPERWGLEGRKIWLPRGIVIPGLWHDEVHYIKVRRPVANDVLGRYIGAWRKNDGNEGVKFGGPRGGRSLLFRVDLPAHFPVLILTEGEWDTILLWEYCLDLCDAGTIGGAQSKFDLMDLALLTHYQKIFVVHDDDKAGDRGREYIRSLQAISPRIVSVPPPAHDLTDFWRSGGGVRGWTARLVAAALREVNLPRWAKVLENAERG